MIENVRDRIEDIFIFWGGQSNCFRDFIKKYELFRKKIVVSFWIAARSQSKLQGEVLKDYVCFKSAGSVKNCRVRNPNPNRPDKTPTQPDPDLLLYVGVRAPKK